MQQINLYNPAFERKREWLSLPGLAAAWGAAAVLALLAITLASMRTTALQDDLAQRTQQRTAAQTELRELAAQVANRRVDAALERDLAGLEQDLASRHQVMTTLGAGALGDTRGFSEHLKAFARQSFDGLWLTGLSVSNAGRDVVLQGRALQPDFVPSYVQRLNRELVMRGHAFAQLEMRRPGAGAAEKQEPLPAFIEFRLATASPEAQAGGRE